MAEKTEKSTLHYYKSWKATKYALYGAKWVFPCVPAIIITAINWNEWFNQQGSSLPFGFASLLISILITILAVYNKDEIVEKKISPLFYIAVIMAVWGVSFMLLSNIMSTMGSMFLFTCLGIVAGGSCDQFEKTVVESRITEYKELIEENNLDIKAQRKAERKAKAEAERKAKDEIEKQEYE